MDKTDTLDKEMAAYQPGPFDDVKIQEALTIIAVYAAQMDYQNCEADVKRIEAILESHQLFVARKKEIFAMINKRLLFNRFNVDLSKHTSTMFVTSSSKLGFKHRIDT